MKKFWTVTLLLGIAAVVFHIVKNRCSAYEHVTFLDSGEYLAGTGCESPAGLYDRCSEIAGNENDPVREIAYVQMARVTEEPGKIGFLGERIIGSSGHERIPAPRTVLCEPVAILLKDRVKGRTKFISTDMFETAASLSEANSLIVVEMYYDPGDKRYTQSINAEADYFHLSKQGFVYVRSDFNSEGIMDHGKNRTKAVVANIVMQNRLKIISDNLGDFRERNNANAVDAILDIIDAGNSFAGLMDLAGRGGKRYKSPDNTLKNAGYAKDDCLLFVRNRREERRGMRILQKGIDPANLDIRVNITAIKDNVDNALAFVVHEDEWNYFGNYRIVGSNLTTSATAYKVTTKVDVFRISDRSLLVSYVWDANPPEWTEHNLDQWGYAANDEIVNRLFR
jgi:hypothetical protein